nr:3'-5' exonuclease [Pseudomonas batumici]
MAVERISLIPQVLRRSAAMGNACLPANYVCYTYGSSKGLGFDRVLLIAPEKHVQFLSGNRQTFDNDKTDESRNKLYVAITRARYSLAIVIDDKAAPACPTRYGNSPLPTFSNGRPDRPPFLNTGQDSYADDPRSSGGV